MKKPSVNKVLSTYIDINTRFSEVDSMGVVWHGNYVKYLEDAREKMGAKFGMGYMDVYRNKFMIPIVKMNLDYKLPLYYEKKYRVHISVLDTIAAKIVCQYEIRNDQDQVCAKAETTQAFINLDGELQLITPQFFIDWKSQQTWQEIK
ncbi:MAG: acyl-CoA thioester hydrolase [Flavobacteriales bacterium]|jgi:acyl-CoA thioester hydrolase